MRTPVRWLVAAGSLGSAAALHGAGVRLVWLPCAGQTVDALSRQCLVAMDSTNPLPVLTEADGLALPEMLSLAAMGLLALAWLVVLPGVRAGRLARIVLAAPSALALAAAAALALGARADALLVAIDLAVVAALLVLVAGRSVEPRGHRGRYVVVLVGATSMSVGHLVAEYSVAVALSDANWDVPPGTGYLTVAWLVVAAVVVGGWDLVPHRPAGEAVPAGSPA